MIQIHSFTFNALQENTYLLWEEHGACAIIDPGCYEPFERKELTDFISKNNLKVELLLNTHCHIDHVLGNQFVKEEYKVQLGIHKIEEGVLRAVEVYAPNYGMNKYEPAKADYFLEEGQEIRLGTSVIKIIFVPGHSPGHVAFYIKEQKMCISGDVLFYSSIGRTDLPGGDFNTLIKSIKTQLFPLGNDVKIYPGHGPITTIGQEIKTNPFLQN